MDFQWYPGHMTKAKRMMQENMKLIDIMIELVDARIPLSSRNPDIDQLAANKSRLILLNKTDMADERVTAQWEEYFKEKGYYNISVKVLQRDDPERPNFVYLDATVERKNKIKISDVIITGNEKVRDSKLKGAMKKTKEKSLRNFFKSAKYIQESYEDDKYNLSLIHI